MLRFTSLSYVRYLYASGIPNKEVGCSEKVQPGTKKGKSKSQNINKSLKRVLMSRLKYKLCSRIRVTNKKLYLLLHKKYNKLLEREGDKRINHGKGKYKSKYNFQKYKKAG